ncbi:MAG: endopeptidase La [Oligoflexales bacterium]
MSDTQHSSESTRIPLLPLRDILVFPSTVVPLFVGREKSIQALEHAMGSNKEILLVAQHKAKVNDPTTDEMFSIGTISTILQLLRLPDGTVKVLVEGQRRARVDEFLQTDEFFLVSATPLADGNEASLENEALIRTVKVAFDNYVRLNKRVPPEMLLSISQIENESKLADSLVSHLSNLKLNDKQELLELIDPRARLEKLYEFIQSEIEIIRVEKKIRARVKRQMEKTQKEYYLNEQMAAIQKELGDRDDGQNDLREMELQLEKRKLSDEAREKLTKEVKKLKQMSPMSAEATVVRNYVETVLSLPWGDYTDDNHSIAHATEVLDRDHYGLERVKDRILEFLSVRALSQSMKGPILCLAGPPGVGKTSLARSVAESLGRKFVRVALGGVADQSEIRGHRKTYIGSMPGKIIMALKKAGSSNPLILLDEVDKMGHDHRGDPSAALLEVLDQEQNHSFNDHYLDLDYDLSRCLFFATANSLDTIPRPLLDRMEVVSLPGYTVEEKLQISHRYLIPKQIKENGLEGQDVSLDKKATANLIEYYTREAGVRSLEREIASLMRKIARRHLSKAGIEPDPTGLEIQEKVNPKTLVKYLGPHRFRVGTQNTHDEIGICTGLAWTSVGGELLKTEIALLPGKGKLMITGKLGDVMQESAHAALSYVRSRAEFLGLKPDFYQDLDIHIHVPEGAIPKDGPSAGLCMATALTSALTKRPISRDVAMTGEITLTGRALPIGGLKEKALAAHRGGISKVIVPIENKKDLHDFPKSLQKHVNFIFVEHMDEVLIHALVWEKEDNKEVQDELFQRLSQITETEVAASNDTPAPHH